MFVCFIWMLILLCSSLLATALQKSDTVLLMYLNRNYLASQVTAQYMVNNFPAVNSSGLLPYFINAAASQYSKPYQLSLLQYIVAQFPMSSKSKSQFIAAINNTQANIAWSQKYGTIISTWIQQTTNMTLPPTTTLATVAPTTPTKVPPTTPTPAPTPLSTRLPNNLTPLRYTLTIQPYYPSSAPIPAGKSNFTFDGKVTILFVALKATNIITLNAWNLNISISGVMVKNVTGQANPVGPVTMIPAKQQVKIVTQNTLAVNSLNTITIKYTGAINDYTLAGLFRTSFVQNGKTVYMLATHFEATRARRMLPCFDEPAYKASFEITVIHPADTIALSNGMEQPPVPYSPGLVSTTFDATLRQSTYLLAIAVGPFVRMSTTNSNGTLVRLWAWPGMEPYMSHGLTSGARSLAFLGGYFQYQFPLKKEDLLALPQFGPGAMENWGLVIFKYQLLLYNSHVQTASDYLLVEKVVSHELSHQWFGDLVTLQWWNDLFLNEGFAQYWMWVVIENIFPSQTYSINLLVESLDEQQGLLVDEYPQFSHPIIYPQGPAFDGITYQKMYLKQHAYSNANHNDLWRALTNVSTAVKDWNGQAINVSNFMNHWTLLRDYPLLTVSRNYAANTATISQTPFNLPYTGSPGTQWYVPVWYTTTGSNNFMFTWLKIGSNLTLPNIPNNQMLVVNPQLRAFCRINYDKQNWQMIATQLMTNPNVLDVTTRAQMIADSVTLVSAGILDYTTFLNLTQYLHNETALTPWQAASGTFTLFQNMFLQTNTFPKLKNFLLDQVEPVFRKLAWNASPSHLDTESNERLLSTLACNLDSPACVPSAIQLMAKVHMACANSTNGTAWCNPVAPDFRMTVYCTAVAHHDTTHFMQMWQLFMQEKAANPIWYQEAEYLLYGLTCAREPWLVYKYRKGFSTYYVTNVGLRCCKPNKLRKKYTGLFCAESSSVFAIHVCIFGNKLPEDYCKLCMRSSANILFSGLLPNFLTSMVTTWNSYYHSELLNIFMTTNSQYLNSANSQAVQQAMGTVVGNQKWLQTQGITHKLDEQLVKHQVSEFSMEWNPNVELSGECGCALQPPTTCT